MKLICSLMILLMQGMVGTYPSSAQSGDAQESSSRGDLERTAFVMEEKPGPYPVGLKVIEQYDYSRTFRPLIDDLGKPTRGERARPIQTLVWYPAGETVSRHMTFSDYIDLTNTETSFGRPEPRPVGPGDEYWFDGWKTARSDKMQAVREAPAAPGRFPIVIYAPSFSAWSWENADLCEYIASHGYVVIAGPGMGITRASTHDVAGTNAQASDISFLIGYAHTLPDADSSEAAVVGFSWGGLSNLFAAARDNRIRALVALDGSMRYFPALVKQAGDVDPEKQTIPLLFFMSRVSIEEEAQLETHFGLPSAPNVLNAWTHGDLISVQMLGFFHPEFSSISQRNETLWASNLPGWQKHADYGRKDGIIAYSWVARYTRTFLDAYLKHKEQALHFLKNTPAENGVPRHVMAVDFRNAAPTPPSPDSFKVALGHQGFDHAAEIYAAMLKQSPDFKLDTEALSSWGYALISAGHIPEAVEIMKLNVQLFPSGQALSGLAEAYSRSGNKVAAIEYYKKALEKTADNVEFKARLHKLESGGSSWK
jgi:pimeloyl-ACP methyl ester carboxylesterase